MHKKELTELIKKLSNAKGAPGFEDEVASIVNEQGKSYGNTVEDKMRNVFIDREENDGRLDDHFDVHATNRRLRVQLDAHLDEVGFIVQYVHPNGLLQIVPLGGWVTSNVSAHQWLVRKTNGEYLTALTASKPPHFMSEDEKKKPLDLQNILLDVGTSSKDETEALGIEIGAPIVPDVKCHYDAERDLFTGKAFDCRSGTAVLLNILDLLRGEKLEVDLFAAFSTQEEVGTRGAIVTSRRVRPDMAVVFEGTPADDSFAPDFASGTKLNHGPMLRHIDNRMVTHPRFQRFALDLAKTLDIPVQRAVRTGGSTNGASIHLSGLGVPTIVIGIPVRYIHTSYGYATYHDHETASRLAVSILRELNRDVYEGF